MFTLSFWRLALERAVVAAVSAVVAVVGGDGVGLLHANVKELALTAAGTAVATLLSAIAATRVHDPNDPTFLKK